jgi:catechol 2,3-dioxygenase-like lactoylglutathione lyase family enzyme
MPRITPITAKSDLPAEHHAVADAVVKVFGQIRGPFSMLLHSPKLAERLLPLVSFFRDQDKGQQPIMAPFAHIGIEVTSRAEVDAIAARGEAEGCLAWAPTEMPPPIGYICALTDPDGNMIEFSFDQGVYATARAVWGS